MSEVRITVESRQAKMIAELAEEKAEEAFAKGYTIDGGEWEAIAEAASTAKPVQPVLPKGAV